MISGVLLWTYNLRKCSENSFPSAKFSKTPTALFSLLNLIQSGQKDDCRSGKKSLLYVPRIIYSPLLCKVTKAKASTNILVIALSFTSAFRKEKYVHHFVHTQTIVCYYKNGTTHLLARLVLMSYPTENPHENKGW